MSPLERRIACLEERRTARARRCGDSCAVPTPAPWFGGGPPNGELRPDDEILELLFIRPTGEYDGRPATAEELAA